MGIYIYFQRDAFGPKVSKKSMRDGPQSGGDSGSSLSGLRTLVARVAGGNTLHLNDRKDSKSYRFVSYIFKLFCQKIN